MSSWRRYGAIYIFLALWLVFLAIHGGLEYFTAVKDAEEHSTPFLASDWFWEWMRATFENLQSEAWQVMASALIIERVAAKRRWFMASEEE